MKPTDQQIEEDVAKVLGRRLYKHPNDTRPNADDVWERAGYGSNTGPPKFCTDRNLLPQLWGYLESTRLTSEYGYRLEDTCPGDADLDWHCMTAPPRAHCEAFLNAVSAWPGKNGKEYRHDR